MGHLEKDCRVRLQGAGNDFLQNITYFGCGEKGHFKDKCPKAGNQENDGARGRAYVVISIPVSPLQEMVELSKPAKELYGEGVLLTKSNHLGAATVSLLEERRFDEECVLSTGN
ncbi:putative reverse transcriptase domain-containing protein [Tanacetum coccineum]